MEILTMGKRFCFLIIMFFQISLNSSMAAEESSSFAFKYQMHQIFDSYSHAWESVSLKKYDIADIYLKHLQDSINEARDYIPGKNADGTKLDKERFTQRLNQLNITVSQMRGTIVREEPKDIKELSQQIFNTCVGCHTEVKLKYLFKLPASRRTLFAEYMHKLSEHIDIARIYTESGKSPEKVEENLRLIRYYLGLLEESFPEKGPSGVILDKGDFDRRLKEIKGISEEVLKSAKDRIAGIEAFKKSLNGFCVICHEPERLK